MNNEWSPLENQVKTSNKLLARGNKISIIMKYVGDTDGNCDWGQL